MRTPTIHRLQGAAVAIVAMLSAGYAMAALHDDAIDRDQSQVAGLGRIALSVHRDARPILLLGRSSGSVVISTVIADAHGDGMVIPAGWLLSHAAYQPAGRDATSSAYRRDGVMREIDRVDCLTGMIAFMGVETSTTPYGLATARRMHKPHVTGETAHPDALRVICRTTGIT